VLIDVISFSCIEDAVGSRLSLRAVVPNVFQPSVNSHVFMLVCGYSLQCNRMQTPKINVSMLIENAKYSVQIFSGYMYNTLLT
jgi:hypothetical protein